MSALVVRLLALIGAVAGAAIWAFAFLVWLSSRDLAEPDPYVITGI